MRANRHPTTSGARSRLRLRLAFFTTALLGTLALAAPSAFATHDAAGVPYQVGDVFAGVGDGQVKHFSPTGTLKHTLDTTSNSVEETGGCFDAPGNLYWTNFQAQNATKFNNVGNRLEHPWNDSPFSIHPESCVADASNNIYTGEVDGLSDLRRWNSSGMQLASWSPLVGLRGVDWIDLASDQCTVYYTSEAPDVRRFDVCANGGAGMQLTNFATGLPGRCFALRIRANGEVMVACTSQLHRLSPSGTIMQTYPAASFTPPAAFLFAMNLDPDGTSVWTADLFSGQIYRIDIATGTQITSFNAQTNTTLAGLAIFGEPQQGGGGGGGGGACPPDDEDDNGRDDDEDDDNGRDDDEDDDNGRDDDEDDDGNGGDDGEDCPDDDDDDDEDDEDDDDDDEDDNEDDDEDEEDAGDDD